MDVLTFGASAPVGLEAPPNILLLKGAAAIPPRAKVGFPSSFFSIGAVVYAVAPNNDV